MTAVGTRRMSWGEAIRLVTVLMADPSSHLAASRAGWDHPVSRETAVLMDLFDLQHRSKAKKPAAVKPYPRPWGTGQRRRFGKTKMTREQVRAVLNAHGHNL